MLEIPKDYNQTPEWLPTWLQSAYRAMNHPLAQMTPMGVAGVPAGIRVLRTTGSIPQRQLLEQVLGTIKQKVRPLYDVINENFNTRIRVSPQLGSEAASSYRAKDVPVTSSRSMPSNPPTLDIKVHPSEVTQGNQPEITKYLIHEFLHPKVSTLRPELLRRIAPRAKASLSEADQPLTDIYKGRDMLEELAVRMMEQNIARKRLGL